MSYEDCEPDPGPPAWCPACDGISGSTSIVVILDRYLRPVAEINTFDLERVELTVHQRPMLTDWFVSTNLFQTWIRIYEQLMLDPAPEQPTLWHVYEGD